MIGTCRPVVFSRSRTAAVASSPHLRHLDIHQDHIERFAFQGGKRFFTVVGDHGRVAGLFQQTHRESLIDHIILGQQNTQRPRSARHGGHRLRFALPRQMQSAADRSEQLGLLDRLHQIRADSQFATARDLARLAAGSQHDQRGAGQLAGPADLRRQGEAIHLRHVAVDQHQRERLAGRRWPVPGRPRRRGRRPPPSACMLPAGRATSSGCGDSSHCHPRPAPAAPLQRAPDRRRAVGVRRGRAEAGREVEACCPRPGSLSTQMRPPISSTSRAEMARPSPVPPYFRVVEPSACAKASKISALLLGRNADAGVADGEVQTCRS